MANPAEVESQVRFALSQLSTQNAHHEFERICRHLTEQFICSNVLPATGPVSAGGDQGRDFETFRTYLREELGPHGAFLGLVSEGTVAFICTIQAENVASKLRSDIAVVCSSGHPVHEIRAFTLASVPVGVRHRLQTEAQETHGVRLEFHDAESITSLLARPEGFWIAERFLSLPAEVRPVAPPADGDLPAGYAERRTRWREERVLYPALGTFLELKAGLRESVHREAARSDLPFWLGLMRELLGSPGLATRIQQRARYELAVATLRGTGDLRPVDDVVRVYLDESLRESEPARIEDACHLLMYVKGAANLGVTTIRAADIERWCVELTRQIEGCIPDETPHRRASLLYSLGYLGLHPTLTDEQLPDEPLLDIDSEGINEVAPPWAPQDVTVPDDFECRDAPRALSAWTELVEGMEDTPLFPLQPLADMLQLLLPFWSTQDEWRRLLDLVDDELGARVGRNTVAERARDRAVALMDSDRILDALEELHRARVDWWSGDTVRGSVLASLLIAQLYQVLRLYTAAKAYALAAATIAATSGDEELIDLAPRGLLMAANCEFLSGAWYGAAELYELGLSAQDHMYPIGVDSDPDEMIQGAVMHLAYASLCAIQVDSALEAAVQAIVERSSVHDVIEDVVDHGLDGVEWSWELVGDGEFTNLPFSDCGDTRYIRFAALGIDWTLLTDNDHDSVRVAERFAAGVQTTLAALAREDLCLIPTEITVRIETEQATCPDSLENVEAIPSNEGREWIVHLAPTGSSSDASLESANTELMTVLTVILREASLLPTDDFFAVMERAFERGLAHKLSPAIQMEEFVETFSDQDSTFSSRSVEVPWVDRKPTFTAAEELHWQDGPGPTYTRTKAEELLRSRYETLARSVRITAAVLSRSEEFQTTLQTLRAEGWLDWHILTAIANIAMNYRFPLNSGPPSEETLREMMRTTLSPESATAPPVPVALFTPERMQDARQTAMLSLLKHWGLECHQRTPDIAAIQKLLAARYGYWDQDVSHEDPFPEADETNHRQILTI